MNDRPKEATAMIDDDELNAEREMSKARCPELWVNTGNPTTADDYKHLYEREQRLLQLALGRETILIERERKLAEDLGEARLALWLVAQALDDANPTDAPWREGDWNPEAHIRNNPTLTVWQARAVLEESGYINRPPIGYYGGSTSNEATK